jgi:putative endonuclease
MFYMYILKSEKDGNLYVGSTNDLKRRFKEHNAGDVESTKPRRPLTILYYEAYSLEEEARDREKQLKLRGHALGQLKRRIERSLQQDKK